MPTKLEKYRLPARLRRRPPVRRADGTVFVTITPTHTKSVIFTEGSMACPDEVSIAYSQSELSSVALMMQKLQRGDDVRDCCVSQVRDALAADRYEEALKLDIAVERLLNDLAPGL